VSRLGLLGGTFDPPHFGHLAAGQEAAEQLGLERVLYLPAGQPPHKLDEVVSPLEPRRRMTELAIAGNPLFRLSLADCEQAEPSYTVDLLARLHRQLPGPTSLYFIVGMDSLRDLTTWRDPARVLRQCLLVVVRRPGYQPLDLQQLEAEVPGAAERIIMLDSPGLDISSTELRARIAAGRSIRYLVPDAVRAYIAEQRLYQSAERAASL
jgi:nicotinate-nucleotide adenylyltransferase